MEHEAGHFLVGYLLGVLPKQYKISSIEDVKQDEVVDASVKFVGFEFLTEVTIFFSLTPLERKKFYKYLHLLFLRI